MANLQLTKKDEMLCLAISSEDKKALQQAAAKQRLSLSCYVLRKLFKDELKKAD